MPTFKQHRNSCNGDGDGSICIIGREPLTPMFHNEIFLVKVHGWWRGIVQAWQRHLLLNWMMRHCCISTSTTAMHRTPGKPNNLTQISFLWPVLVIPLHRLYHWSLGVPNQVQQSEHIPAVALWLILSLGTPGGWGGILPCKATNLFLFVFPDFDNQRIANQVY